MLLPLIVQVRMIVMVGHLFRGTSTQVSEMRTVTALDTVYSADHVDECWLGVQFIQMCNYNNCSKFYWVYVAIEKHLSIYVSMQENNREGVNVVHFLTHVE